MSEINILKLVTPEFQGKWRRPLFSSIMDRSTFYRCRTAGNVISNSALKRFSPRIDMTFIHYRVALGFQLTELIISLLSIMRGYSGGITAEPGRRTKETLLQYVQGGADYNNI